MASQKPALSKPFEVEEATIVDLQAAMARGLISAIALVDHYLERIDQFDGQLNALISLNPDARETAIYWDKERAEGRIRGPLHGIPIVIKDNINTADLPTTGGCQVLATLQPPADAFVVAQLRAAGAIVLAKANLHELACSGETLSSLGGQTYNPYHLGYTPGGSSGGTAAALAANLAAVGLGTDTVNSVRSPASACNIVGLRPTLGLVSRHGLMPVALSQDVIGPMGRTVADVAAVLDVIAIPDVNDPMTARSAGHPRGGYQKALTQGNLKRSRLGIVRSLFGTKAVHEEVNDLMDAAIAKLRQMGSDCLEVAFSIDIDQMLKELSLLPWEGKLHFNKYLESLDQAAPVKSLKALLNSGQVHPSVQPLLKQMQAVESPLGSSEYWERLYPRRAELRTILFHIFQHYQLDALIYPHQKCLVAAIGETQQDRNGFLAAASGFPAITVPAGFAAAGLPVGLELMGQPFDEANLLRMAYAYEQATQWRRHCDLFA